MNYRRVYADGYSYFLTVVTCRRAPLLVDNIELLRQAFALSKSRYDYKIDAITVLPDHFHMIMTPEFTDEYPKIISHIKRSFTYALTVGRSVPTSTSKIIEQNKIAISQSKNKRQHAGIWQERFYEHTIRGEKDWQEKMEYIRLNPVKHGLVDTIDQWQYTSFAK